MNCENCKNDEGGSSRTKSLLLAVPLALLVIGLFILLQKAGLLNLLQISAVGYGTAFIIGLIASVSSCMAVVGGLVLSMSASFAQSGDKVRPQLLFHVGRLVSFFILGGVIGLLGSTFQLGGTSTFILNVIVAIVLLILGLNLLDVFPRLKKWQPTLPLSLGRRIHDLRNLNHNLTPLFLGVLTFFLPCGFTQSMQIYTLSTGDFLTGALIMFSFALGTLPVLAILSFSSLTIKQKGKSDIFFKAVGLIVIFFAVFNLMNSIRTLDLTPVPAPVKNITGSGPSAVSENVKMENGRQVITLKTRGGYSPEKSLARANLPTVIRFDTNGTFDCSLSVRIPSLNYSRVLPQTGSTEVSLGTSTAGLFRGSCGMGMYPFEIDFQ
jgi:sulfite exporter TauE/SafE